MHLLVSLLFHELTSLHPPSFQRNDFSTFSLIFSLLEYIQRIKDNVKISMLILQNQIVEDQC